MKAIETSYKGCRFRSRLEARWAVLFDALGWAWEYELEGFDLGGGDYYLPDFALMGGETRQAVQCWVEVKPTEPDSRELRVAKKLALHTGVPVLFAIGSPDADKIADGLGGFDPNAIGAEDYYPAGLGSLSYYCRLKWNRPGWLMGGASPAGEEEIEACERARSARFEHGEKARA